MLWVFYYNKNKCGIAKVNLSREGEYKVMVIGRKSPLGTWCSESETWTQAQLLVSKSPTFSSSHLWLETRTPCPTSEELAYLVKVCSELIKFYHKFYHEGITTQRDGKAHCKFVFQ